ncbi:hypothetical protein K461DRAFT_294564 [Myriangium duriaei CBS 260.36]|uniref:Rhodopsin domain-containing protein n=1 Tax=Myriangium duriaei CBS 260.36 TaxID=1168546 RepID=A0A9P4MG09_9PEZI|nr:hypothetical protein K461DRAFT_294564 [Myriangium duriaei CBS 260.36]
MTVIPLYVERLFESKQALNVSSNPNNLSPAALAALQAQNRAPSILTFLGVIGMVALIITCLRLYVRQCMLKYVGADDIVMAGAMICGIAIYVCFIGESKWGLGRHVSALTPEMMYNFSHWTFYHNLLILAGICLAKVSICLLLIRLVKHRGYVYFLWGLLIFMSAYHIACEFTIIFACIPTSAQWDPKAKVGAKCFSLETFSALGLANTSINMATDILLAILPIPVIMGMQLNGRTKLALCVVMLLGFIAVGAGGVKLNAQITFLSDNDKLWRDKFPIWAAVELYFAIIAASLPTLRPLAIKLLANAKTSISSSNARRSARRHAKLADENSHGFTKSPGTFYSECSTGLATPDPLSKQETSSYFNFMKKDSSRQDSFAHQSRGASIPLSTMPASSPAPVQPAPTAIRGHSPASSKSDDASRGAIVRTTKVTTSSEEAGSPMVPTSTFTAASWRSASHLSRSSRGKQSSFGASRTWAGPENEEWEQRMVSPVQAGGHSRKLSSHDAGMALRRAQESEEDLPSPLVAREGSVDRLVGNAR